MQRDEGKHEIIGVYDRAAPLFDQVGTRQFTYFGNLLVNSLHISSGSYVLDVASGRGALLFAAAEKAGTSGRVIGIDLAPTMGKETRAEIQRRNLTHVE